MKRTTLQNAMAIGVLAIASGYAVQASALPTFTFTEVSGFEGGDVSPGVAYTNQVVSPIGPADASASPQSGPVYGKMEWNTQETPLTVYSSLEVSNPNSPGALPTDGTWVDITHLVHNNIVIRNAFDWSGQDVWGRLIITQTGFGKVLDDNDPITLSFDETSNVPPGGVCPDLNPNGTTCDDFFTFTAVGLDPLQFNDSNGRLWQVDFRLNDLVNAFQIGPSVYTGEASSSSLNVEMSLTCIDRRGCEVTQIPEPSILTLLGLGLLGLGFGSWRRQRGMAA